MVIYEKMINPRIYIEIITGKYYILNADKQLDEMKQILKREEFGVLCDYPMSDIEKVADKDKKFVLVEFVNITKNDTMDYTYRWCELPVNITKERIIEMME